MPPKIVQAERAYLNSLEKADSSDPGKDLYPVAFSELVIYIMDSKANNTEATPVVFRMADLASLYKLRLEQLGVDLPNVHSTLLSELEAHKKGRDVLLAFKTDIASVLHEASQSSNAIHLSKAADILRKEMLQHKTKFSNELKDGFGEEAIPPALLQFVCSIEHGVDIKSHMTHGIAKSDIAMAQLLQFNCYSYHGEGSTIHRHCKDHETPFAIYVGLKRELIDKLHENGLSMSYDRVLEKSETLLLKEDCQLSSQLFISCQTRGHNLPEFFKHENQSFPPSLSKQGKLHIATKSDLVNVLQTKVELPETKPETDVLIVDGTFLVNTVMPKTPKTFEEYARNDIFPKVEHYSGNYKRTDINFNIYHESSLKSEARSK